MENHPRGEALRIIRNKEYKKTFWSGGTTIEIYLDPEEGNYSTKEFNYRISTATIETEESLFTVLPGIERVILPLENRMVLLHGEEVVVLSPYEAYRFQGERSTRSRGINRDFNLMMNHGKHGEVEILTINPESAMTLKAENTLCFYEKGAEALGIEEERVFPGDSILIRNQESIIIRNNSPMKVTLIKVFMSDLGS